MNAAKASQIELAGALFRGCIYMVYVLLIANARLQSCSSFSRIVYTTNARMNNFKMNRLN